MAARTASFSGKPAWSAAIATRTLPLPAREQRARRRDDGLWREPEPRPQRLEGRGGAEPVHADDGAAAPHVPIPAERRGLLHGDARRHLGWEHARAVGGGLLLEELPGGHAHDAGADPPGREHL